jgi:uncharacterized protein
MTPARYPRFEQRLAAELRATAAGCLEGYAAVFNTEAQIGAFREVIRPGAFRKTLIANPDILLLAEHDTAKVLARTSAGNLQLSEDAKGLRFSAQLPDTTAARDTWALVQSGTAGGCSIGFRAASERWQTAGLRELLAIDLIECSIIASFPAYADTSVLARSRGGATRPSLIVGSL